MNAKRLQQIEKRAKKATKGPWSSAAWMGNNFLKVDTNTTVLAMFSHENMGNDTAFCAHARQDIPDLCAALRQSSGLNAILLRGIAEIIGQYDNHSIGAKSIVQALCELQSKAKAEQEEK